MAVIKNNKGYLSLYESGRNGKIIRYLGKEENFTPEKLNYLKRKYGGKIKEKDDRQKKV